jgi:LacI family transcriptional regulator
MATIRDVARRAGVSPATVSYVLNNSGPVRPETRERVLRAIAELGYHPHAGARQLKRRRTDTIGLILPTGERRLSDPFFLELIHALLPFDEDLVRITRLTIEGGYEAARALLEAGIPSPP